MPSAHGLMEGRVKHRHLRDLRAEGGRSRINALKGGRIVQRGQRLQAFDICLYLVGDDDRAVIFSTTLHHAVANGIHLGQVADNLALSLGQRRLHLSKRFGVVAHGGGGFPDVAVGFMREDAVIGTNTLANTLGQHLFALHVDELIFQRRTASVDNQNFHNFCNSSLILSHTRYIIT